MNRNKTRDLHKEQNNNKKKEFKEKKVATATWKVKSKKKIPWIEASVIRSVLQISQERNYLFSFVQQVKSQSKKIKKKNSLKHKEKRITKIEGEKRAFLLTQQIKSTVTVCKYQSEHTTKLIFAQNKRKCLFDLFYQYVFVVNFSLFDNFFCCLFDYISTNITIILTK